MTLKILKYFFWPILAKMLQNQRLAIQILEIFHQRTCAQSQNKARGSKKINVESCKVLKKLFLGKKKDEKQARAALESSSKRGSSDRISNRLELKSIEMGHLTYNMGTGHWRF